MDSWVILKDILILLSAAFIMGSIAELLKQSAIVGYILAGMIVGPYGLKLVHSHQNMELIAEMGVALLLFSIGLEFSVNRLKRLGSGIVVGGILQVVVTVLLGAGVLLTFGVNSKTAVFIGAMVALSSTAGVLRLLNDRAALDSTYGRNSLGILLLQDIAVLPLTIILAFVAGQGVLKPPDRETMEKAGIIIVSLVVFYLLFAQAIPRIMKSRPWGGNRELPVVLALMMAVGAALAAHQVGVSPALGAFAAGLMIAGTPFATQVRADVGTVRATLVTLFFVSIGMLGNPAFTLHNWHIIILFALAVIVGKSFIITVIMKLLRNPLGMSFATGLCLAQVGEFSFVLAELGRGTVFSDRIFSIFVSVTVITFIATPFLISKAPVLADILERKKPLLDRPPVKAHECDNPIPIIGFGPAGISVVEHLMNKMSDCIVVVDSNPENGRKASKMGVDFIAGDASHPDILEHAGIHRARIAVVTIPDWESSIEIISLCRSLNPGIEIIARGRYHRYSTLIKKAGAAEVVDEEEQVGNSIAELVLRKVE